MCWLLILCSLSKHISTAVAGGVKKRFGKGSIPDDNSQPIYTDQLGRILVDNSGQAYLKYDVKGAWMWPYEFTYINANVTPTTTSSDRVDSIVEGEGDGDGSGDNNNNNEDDDDDGGDNGKSSGGGKGKSRRKGRDEEDDDEADAESRDVKNRGTVVTTKLDQEGTLVYSFAFVNVPRSDMYCWHTTIGVDTLV